MSFPIGNNGAAFSDYSDALIARSNYRGCARVKAVGSFSTCDDCGGNSDCPILAGYRAREERVETARNNLRAAQGLPV
jgi:hypothetical protein